MKINPQGYPYPVLYNGHEDVSGRYDVSYTLNEIERVIEISVYLENDVIEEMIRNGDAIIIVHLEASSTSYRNVLEMTSFHKTISIDHERMLGDLEINTVIISNKDIPYYQNQFDNRIYDENFSFKDIERGYPLAVTDTYIVEIENDGNQFNDIPSIMNVGKTQGKNMELDLDGDTITLKLPDSQYEDYNLLSKSGQSMQHLIMNATIFPAIVLVLEKMANQDNSPIDPRLDWYRVIEAKMKEHKIDVEDINESHSSIKIAQIILDDPLSRTFEAGRKILDVD